jgi:hypothetical protein
VFGKDIVGTKSVNIFGVEEKTIQIEDAGAYGGKSTDYTSCGQPCLPVFIRPSMPRRRRKQSSVDRRRSHEAW